SRSMNPAPSQPETWPMTRPQPAASLAPGAPDPEGKAMKLSARNIFKGKVVDIDKGQVTAIVRVDIGGGNIVTSSITLVSAKELALKKGSDVSVIIKASEVILGVN